MNAWVIIAVAGAGTFAIRFSVLAIQRFGELPARAREALHYVTPAVLAAIIVPAVLYTGDNADLTVSAGNERIFAALAAGAIAWATRNVWLTIGIGMAALWALKALS